MKKVLPLLFAALVFFATRAGAICAPPQWEVTAGWSTTAPVEYKNFFSPTHGAPAGYGVYLPPAYALDPARRFPVLYWLHGGGSNLISVEQFILFADSAIARGAAPPFIIVVPNGPQSMWTDSKPGATPYDAPIESVIINELIPLIDANYRTMATRAGRGIEGFSMGGRGSSRLGLKHPDLFGLISNLAGAVQGLEFWQSDRKAGNNYDCVWGADPVYFDATSPQTHAAASAAFIQTNPTRIRIVVGVQDLRNYPVNLEFSNYLLGLGIDNTFVPVNGAKHSYEKIYMVMGDALFSFFAQAWAGL